MSEVEGERPTIRYGADGQVISEPDIGRRVREETQKEIDDLHRRLSGDTDAKVEVEVGQYEGSGLPISREVRMELKSTFHGDCCDFSRACGAMFEELGMTPYLETECCQRATEGRAIYLLDRKFRGIDPVVPEATDDDE